MRVHGSCLCKGVVFTLDPPLRDVVACHCSQCRKTSGHFWAATSVPIRQFHLDRSETLAWYRSSEAADRGFCRVCGASLFWKPAGEDRMAVAAGALEPPTGISLVKHIYVAAKPSYYDLDDGVVQVAE